jgi:hypothetical protein
LALDGQRGIIRIAFRPAAKKRHRVERIERRVAAQAFDQIGIGDERPAKGDEIGAAGGWRGPPLSIYAQRSGKASATKRRGKLRLAKEKSLDADRRKVQVENLFFLAALIMVLLADRDHLAHDFHVIARALGFGVNFLDVVGDRLLFLFETLDAFDESFQMAAVERIGVHEFGLKFVGKDRAFR